MKFKINKEVFEKFPNLIVYIPIIEGFDNSKNQANLIIAEKLREACEKSCRANIKDLEELKQHPYIKAYFECFKSFGIDPTKSMPTHFALAKRVISEKNLPVINPIVDIYNSISIKYLTPFGGEDLATVYGDFELKFANGDEHWLGIAEVEPKSPPKGNLIWQDDYDVSTVSLNWRQCDRTKLTEQSKSGYFIMDGFSDVNATNIKNAAEEFIKIITENFGGKAQLIVLDKEHYDAEIEFASKNIEGVQKPIVKQKEAGGAYDVNERQTIKQSKSSTANVDNYTYEVDSIEEMAQKLIYESLHKIQTEPILEKNQISIDRTQDESKGDYTSTFALKNAHKFNLKPIELGQKVVDIINQIKPITFSKVEAVMPGFVNFFVDRNFVKMVINSDSTNFGKHKVGQGKTVMIEFGQPNTHKAMTLGHVKSGISGQCLVNLYKTLGYNVIKANYFSDIGLHVPKCMVGLFQKYCKTLEFNEQNIEKVLEDLKKVYNEQGVIEVATILGRAYPEGHELYKSDESIKEIIDEVNRKIFAKEDDMLNHFYQVTRQYSVEYQDHFFAQIGIKFDRQYAESEVYLHGGEIVKANVGNVFMEDGGSIIFPGEKYGLNRWVFMNKKGVATYSGKDLGLGYMKFQEYPELDHAIVLTSVEQVAYFKAVIKALELIDEKFIGKYKHIGFGWLLYGGKKLSSKTWKGSAVDAVFAELYEYAAKMIDESKGYDKTLVESIARNVAISSLKFAILSHEFHKDVNYDPEGFTSMTGFSAPYIMYSYTRAASILENLVKQESFELKEYAGDWSKVLDSKEELDLCKLLSKYPEVTLSAGQNITPHRICTYLYELANAFNAFYNKCRVVGEVDYDKKLARALLINLSKSVIKQGLGIIGIDTVEKM